MLYHPFAGRLTLGIVVASVLLAGGRYWLRNHDSRPKPPQTGDLPAQRDFVGSRWLYEGPLGESTLLFYEHTVLVQREAGTFEAKWRFNKKTLEITMPDSPTHYGIFKNPDSEIVGYVGSVSDKVRWTAIAD